MPPVVGRLFARVCFEESKLNKKLYIRSGLAVFLVFALAHMHHAVAAEPAESTVQKRFLKFDANGNKLQASATNWSCVNDLETNLYWLESIPSSRHSAVERIFRWGG